MPAPARLLIVSNRLPVTARVREDTVRLIPASGGLATGLRRWHEGAGARWIGWPGEVAKLTDIQRADLERQLDERAITPVFLTRDHVDRYYHGFANRVLWPLFHYLIDRVPVDATGWDAYVQVNEAFADTVARAYRSGDTIWVHDYQLMLLPALLRERLPEARIGFFLHIPFPSSEVFRILPWRRQILTGLLGADLLGFHTFAYMRHFLASLLHIDGVEAEIDRVRVGGREVKLGVFPMGVDVAAFADLAQERSVQEEAAAIRREAGGRHIVLGIDRLDYTKGIPRRLQAIERLFARHPDLRDRVRYIQVAVPSREGVDSYQRFRRQVEETVGRINGLCGSLGSTPIHYVHRSVSMQQLVALYAAADVMLVTPLRDGMNLVAKEFAAARTDDDGVLVLSEFAGAAAELCGALVVNPYDVDAVADAVASAVSMGVEERRSRMQSVRRRVLEHDVSAWANAFLGELRGQRPEVAAEVLERPRPALSTAVAEAQRATNVRLLLDYDGTLVPLARAPELATPDAELLELLEGLAGSPGIAMEIVSGRARPELEAWLGHLPIALWAEHGFWHRRMPSMPWAPAAVIRADWMDRILPMFEQFTASTPGARLEIKSAAIAWHFREAQREFGARQAHELRMLLGDALSNQPLEVLEGKKVIEVRFRGVSKAVVAHHPRCDQGDWTAVALGDDRTDEDLFRALPESSITVGVGRALMGAKYAVTDYRDVRRLLRSMLADAEAHPGRAQVSEPPASIATA